MWSRRRAYRPLPKCRPLRWPHHPRGLGLGLASSFPRPRSTKELQLLEHLMLCSRRGRFGHGCPGAHRGPAGFNSRTSVPGVCKSLVLFLYLSKNGARLNLMVFTVDVWVGVWWMYRSWSLRQYSAPCRWFLEVRQSLSYFTTCKNRLISLPKTWGWSNPHGGLGRRLRRDLMTNVSQLEP